MTISNLSNHRAEEIDTGVHRVFEKHQLDPKPCGYSMSGDGLWFFEYHVKHWYGWGWFRKWRRIDANAIFEEILNVFHECGIKNPTGSGFGYIGDGWWFFHFHVLPNPAE